MDERNMVQYWIATSNWYNESPIKRPCSGAIDRNRKKIWWFRNGTKIERGDKAIIYLHEKNEQADGENIKIDTKLQKSFIGYFTIDEIFYSKYPKINIQAECWDNTGGWVTIKDNYLCPPDRVVRRRDINNDNRKCVFVMT